VRRLIPRFRRQIQIQKQDQTRVSQLHRHLHERLKKCGWVQPIFFLAARHYLFRPLSFNYLAVAWSFTTTLRVPENTLPLKALAPADATTPAYLPTQATKDAQDQS